MENDNKSITYMSYNQKYEQYWKYFATLVFSDGFQQQKGLWQMSDF